MEADIKFMFLKSLILLSVKNLLYQASLNSFKMGLNGEIKVPVISVIMGVYNCESTIKRSIESILNQTYSDWELIICDDYSTDQSYMIANEYAHKYENITVIKNESNKGLAYTLNKCLEVAKGKYIARMDSDDISLNTRFEKQIEFLQKNKEYEVVGSSVILYDDSGDISIRNTIEIPNKYDLIKTVPFIHPTIMIYKEIYDNLNGYTVSKRTRRGQDADFWFKFYSNGYKGYNIQEPLLKYHESLTDYKKRSLRVAFWGARTRYIGYKSLKLPLRYYFHVLKPIIVALLPNKLMYFYHKRIRGVKI
ncbi:MAG: glycosyltransferase [Clostridiales bacterium]|nr:glycosyltransferase [Clostridiales bacterium]